MKNGGALGRRHLFYLLLSRQPTSELLYVTPPITTLLSVMAFTLFTKTGPGVVVVAGPAQIGVPRLQFEIVTPVIGWIAGTGSGPL